MKSKTNNQAGAMNRNSHTFYEWICPDCESSTNGTEPDKTCRLCGQGNIIRDIGLEEAIGTGAAELEMDYV